MVAAARSAAWFTGARLAAQLCGMVSRPARLRAGRTVLDPGSGEPGTTRTRVDHRTRAPVGTSHERAFPRSRLPCRSGPDLRPVSFRSEARDPARRSFAPAGWAARGPGRGHASGRDGACAVHVRLRRIPQDRALYARSGLRTRARAVSAAWVGARGHSS